MRAVDFISHILEESHLVEITFSVSMDRRNDYKDQYLFQNACGYCNVKDMKQSETN